MFLPVLGRQLLLRRMSPQSIYDRMDWIGARAGVKQFSPHDLRRSLISALLDGGADLVAVQRLAGHASPTTTARYDRRSEKVLERLAKAVDVPFLG
jgi:site-specific recombinase XerD